MIGSLNYSLTYSDYQLPSRSRTIGGEENTIIKLQRAFHGEFDIVVQNPPFTRPGSDSNTDIPKSTFQGNDRPEEDQKLMQAALKSKNTRVTDGTNGFVSAFVDLADKKLKSGGTMGFILPLTVLRSPTTEKLREMWATEYHNVIVITVAPARGDKLYIFSRHYYGRMHNSCGQGQMRQYRTRQICMFDSEPQSALEVWKSRIRLIEVTIHGHLKMFLMAVIINVLDSNIGQILDCAINDDVAWIATRAKSMALLQTWRINLELGSCILYVTRYYPDSYL